MAHDADDMLTTAELADELKLSVRTLARWRAEGTGPPFARAGRAIRYRWADVQRWLASTGGTSGPPWQ